MAIRVERFDWGATPLGARAGWPATLRTAVDTCLNSPISTFVWWGPHMTNIYNDAHALVLGALHPDALGRSGPDVWSDVWPSVSQEAKGVLSRGVPVIRERVRLDVLRDGRLNEMYLTYAISPIPDGYGGIGGLYHISSDETVRVLADREREQLRDHGEMAVMESKVAAAEASLARWQSVIAGMREGVILADPQGNLLDWNRAALAIHGYDDVTDVLRHLSDFASTFSLMTPEGQPLPFDRWPMPRLLAGDVFTDEEFHVRRRDIGLDQIVSYSGVLIRDEASAVTLALLTMHEVKRGRRETGTSVPGGMANLRSESEDQRIERLAEEAAENVESLLHAMDLSLGEREFTKALGEHLVDEAIDAYVTTKQEGKGYDGSCIAASVAVAMMIVREPT